MKSQKIIFSFLVLMLCSLGGCKKYLDKLPDDLTTEQETFTRYERVDKLVTDLYAKSKGANVPLTWFAHFSSAAITDEAEGTNVEGGITNSFNTGDWTANGIPGSVGQYWADLYAGIRKANVILAGVQNYHTPDNPIQPGDLEKRIGETYFLRAYLHYLVLRIYGEAPYVEKAVQTNDVMDFKKESAHSLVQKIIKDAEEGIKRLPAVQDGQNFGRVDKGACLGLIAIARWTVATPLWNGAAGLGYKGSRQFETEYGYNQDRWERAKEAAKAVLELKTEVGAPRYKLYEKYSANDFNDSASKDYNGSTVYTRLWQMFYDIDAFQNEAVWFVTKTKYEGWFGDVYPPSRGGSARQQPVQEQVDEYEYISPDGYGYPIYSAKAKGDGYDDSNPYKSVKRDPRFSRDIIFHGAAFRNGSNQPSILNTAAGSDRINASNATKTGYYLRKFLQEGWNRDGSVSISAPAVWRLPEFIYIYAEAVNETSGPTREIYDLINKVRARSFMAPMPLSTLSDKSLMREYIKRERRVEFFYENKRAFDFRLYLEPSDPAESNKEQLWQGSGGTNTERSQKYWLQNQSSYPKMQHMINGMRPVEDPNGKIEISGVKYRMERFFVEDRVFESPKHYLFPILVGELQRTPGLTQNPGW
ncbi:RagB/SusD family nutrient uptake outer membrane protein [Pedobacter antarcticus]|uniref:RagB/SusD family nutrient uptake outer membrane protein n=1 Tax=Pedobacter antarcticus TaxID=34086 RepID=UPI001C5767F9|nr:RagB/SusD family nutrient uptake outer membrane protein [Pedobacter antarcticus]